MPNTKLILQIAFIMITCQFSVNGAPLTTTDQSIQDCLNQDVKRQPVIIDTDTDVDDLWAVHYMLNVPTVNVLAITTSGTGYSTPIYSQSNVLSFLDFIGCTDGVGVGHGINNPLLSSGFNIPKSLLNAIDTYMTAPTCLNRTANMFLQPSPFNGIELIKLVLKYSKVPVDILVLGPMTNIATAISEDRSLVSKIGTVYFSGGRFRSVKSHPLQAPNKTLSYTPGTEENTEASPNVFLDIQSIQRVGLSGVKNMVAMPVSTQEQLTVNRTQVDQVLSALNIKLSPFTYSFVTSFANCTKPSQGESFLKWWDNSAAQFMVQLQTNNTQGFCRQTKQVKALYLLSPDAHQYFGYDMLDVETYYSNVTGLVNYTICTDTDANIFLSEFLTKINSGQLNSCSRQYSERFDIKLQRCMMQAYSSNGQINAGGRNYLPSVFLFAACMVFIFTQVLDWKISH